MKLISAENVNDAYEKGLDYLNQEGIRSGSRNGSVVKAPGPVITTYSHPFERVLFHPVRDANPFFHLFESIWMLAGRNDVKFPARFAGQIAQYSDNGETLHGAYGFRWRSHYKVDQLRAISRALTYNREDRRQVLSMWDPYIDPPVAELGGKDVPCNTHAYFDVTGGTILNMTVCNRSNDAVWGAYGANAVHMSFLLEYVARSAGLTMGEYRQFSNNFHIYEKHYSLMGMADPSKSNPYDDLTGITSPPLFDRPDQSLIFDVEAIKFCDYIDHDRLVLPFFSELAVPMYKVWFEYKTGDKIKALKLCDAIQASDWQTAAKQWIGRRIA